METLKNIPLNIKEFEPDIMMSVPPYLRISGKNIEKNIQQRLINRKDV